MFHVRNRPVCVKNSLSGTGGGRAASTKRNTTEYCCPLLVHILLPCSFIHERLSLYNPPSFFLLMPASLHRCWCGTSYFHEQTPVCTFITEPLWCGDVREDEDAAPMSRRKNVPFIYFKGNKKSFPRVSKDKMQLCQCSFGHLTSEDLSPPLFPQSSLRAPGRHVFTGTGQTKVRGGETSIWQLRCDPRWETPIGFHGSTVPVPGSPSLAPRPPRRCCRSFCHLRSTPTPPPPRRPTPHWPSGPRHQTSESGHCHHRGSRSLDPSAAPGSENEGWRRWRCDGCHSHQCSSRWSSLCCNITFNQTQKPQAAAHHTN